MTLLPWIKRFAFVFSAVAIVLTIVYLLRGRAPADAVGEAALWSAIAAAIVVATRVVRQRRGETCAICQDAPAQQDRS
ncbi:MAG TPA: hypothetical protein VFQ16_02895 [Burkholderiaceae bacterium]|nr:hypothetical protein [Burkholderiaceae bacterium]